MIHFIGLSLNLFCWNVAAAAQDITPLELVALESVKRCPTFPIKHLGCVIILLLLQKRSLLKSNIGEQQKRTMPFSKYPSV